MIAFIALIMEVVSAQLDVFFHESTIKQEDQHGYESLT